jgi:multidrug efflux pump subunit AcrB
MKTAEKEERFSGTIAWMAGHSVTANLLMLVLLLGGLIFSLKIKKEVFPDFELDMVNITVPYPGASPEEIEKGILLAIEESIIDLEGVKKVVSSAAEGVAQVTVEIHEGEDVQAIAQELKNEVDRITSFPEEAEEPQVVIAKRRRFVVSLALYGNQSERVLRELAEVVRDRLLQDPAITQVELVGVRPLEISVEISQDSLRTYNLTLGEVAQRIRQASVELPGGAIKSESGDILVRIKDRRDFGREFANVPIVTTREVKSTGWGIRPRHRSPRR